jgi:hypothetical protein
VHRYNIFPGTGALALEHCGIWNLLLFSYRMGARDNDAILNAYRHKKGG